MARFPDFTAGEVVTDTKMDQVSLDFIRKTADESVTSSATLQNDDHLLATIGATGTYLFDLWLRGTSAANAAGDLAIGFTYPTGTLDLFGLGLDGTLASGTTGTVQATSVSPVSGNVAAFYGLSTSIVTINIRGILIATATGTLQFQWAQQASNANASTIKAGSHLTVRQVA